VHGREEYLNTVGGRVHHGWTWCGRCHTVYSTARWLKGEWRACPNVFCTATGADAWPWEKYVAAHIGVLEFPNTHPGEGQYRPASRPVPLQSG
jgi:hypothetical protein